MKKYAAFLIAVLMTAGPAYGYDTGRRSDRNVFQRIAVAEGRGILNVVGMPLELVRTPIAEAKRHKWIWPVSFVPRLITNIIGRSTSAVYDIAFSPIIYPFSNDTTPLTDPMGLPDYPWQIGENYF